MDDLKIPQNLPNNQYGNFMHVFKKGYEKYIKLIYNFGSICMLEQIIRIECQKNPNLSELYVRKKVSNVLKELENMKFIGLTYISQYYKCVYLKKYAHIYISGSTSNYRNISKQKLFRNSYLNSSIMKAEYYIETQEIISSKTLTDQLVTITKSILNSKKKLGEYSLPYKESLMTKIIEDGGISECVDEINNLPAENLLKILWVDIYDIFLGLKLQGQTISRQPFYYKLYKHENAFYLHYVPEIIIFDVHNTKYYRKKLNLLFDKFYKITTNDTMYLRNKFKEKKGINWVSNNHIGYSINLIGSNYNELVEKKKFIDEHNINNINQMMLGECETKCINIEKYFLSVKKQDEMFTKIDDTFDKLMMSKMN